MKQKIRGIFIFVFSLFWAGCTVKAVGDPNRPITINAHVTVDIRGLKDTANSIEDYVSGGEAPAANNMKGDQK